MPVSVGQQFLSHYREHLQKSEPADVAAATQRGETEMMLYMDLAVQACAGGVARTHMIGRDDDGSLLLELFTRDGRGLLICRDIYDGVRQATSHDVASLLRLTRPLELDGTLVPRTEGSLRAGVADGNFHVIEREGTIIACASLTIYSEGLGIPPERSWSFDRGSAPRTDHDVGRCIQCLASQFMRPILEPTRCASPALILRLLSHRSHQAEEEDEMTAEIGCIAVDPNAQKRGTVRLSLYIIFSCNLLNVLNWSNIFHCHFERKP